MIPNDIQRKHILQAIDELQSTEIPSGRQSTKFDLVYEGKAYPPKYVLTLAYRYAKGVELSHKKFSGGEEANSFLESRGFEVQEKASKEDKTKKGAWTERECYFAVWGYDQLDQDRSQVKTQLYDQLSAIIDRSVKSIEWKIQNVSFFDPRPRKEKPIAEAPNAQKLIGEVFLQYWADKESARGLFDKYLQESSFKTESPTSYSGKMDSKALRTIIIEEGAEGFTTSRSKKRSSTLLKEGRKYFKGLNNGKLVCAACGYVKPDGIEREIIQLHHTDMISEYDKDGQEMLLEDAIKTLIPLCPTCHQVAHTEKPPLPLRRIKNLIQMK